MEMSGQLHAPAVSPQEKEVPVRIRQEAGWAPEPEWTRWRGENVSALAGNRTPTVKPNSLASVLAELSTARALLVMER